MKYIQSSILALLVIGSLFFTACGGGNNSDAPPSTKDTNVSVPVVDSNDTKVTLVMPVSAIVLTTNSQVVNIDVKVFDSSNNPYSTGIVTKVNPNDVRTGRDIGSFDKDTSTLVNGVARFVYTGPTKLDENTSNLSFSFYHESNSTNARTYTMSIVPEVNQTVLTSYSIIASNSDDKTMNLEGIKSISYSVVNALNQELPDDRIQSITVTSLNPSLVTLKDSSGNSGTQLSITSKNGFSINAISNTRSGLVPIKVDVRFIDSNNIEQNLTEIFELVILSGPPTAMSLSYASTEQNAQSAKFIENWVLTITDKYANLVNTTPSISMGALIGYARSSASTSNPAGYLYYNASSGSGTLRNANPDTFTAGVSAFGNIDLGNDKLVLFGSTGYRFDAFGKWDISNTNATNQLELLDNYNGAGVTDLGYAVGHNFRNEVCSGNSVVANVYAKDGNNVLGTTGSMVIQVEYDYYLVGKDVVLWTNLVGSSNNSDVKIGLGKKVTLRGEGLEAQSYSFNKGFSGIVRFDVSIKNTVEFYKNANFGYRAQVTGNDVVWAIAGTSMSDGTIVDCNLNGSDGVAYIDVNIISAQNAGTIEISNLLPSSEF